MPGSGASPAGAMLQVFGPQAGHRLVTLARRRERLALEALTVAVPATLDPLAHQAVRHADEIGDILGGRPLEHPLRRVELLDRALAHDRQAIAERERLGLIVRDEHRRELQPRVQLVDLRADEVAQPRVQVAQRLVEQHQPRPGDQASGERHALLLTAAELCRDTGPAAARSRPAEPSPRPIPRRSCPSCHAP